MNRPTKILFCSVLAVISFLCLGAVFTAPPPFWRNAWSTNRPPRAVIGPNSYVGQLNLGTDPANQALLYVNANSSISVQPQANILLVGDSVSARSEMFLHGSNAFIRFDEGSGIQDVTTTRTWNFNKYGTNKDTVASVNDVTNIVRDMIRTNAFAAPQFSVSLKAANITGSRAVITDPNSLLTNASGTANSTTYLRGDGTYQPLSALTNGQFIASNNGNGTNTTLLNPTNSGQLTWSSDLGLISAIDSIDGLLKLLFFFTDGDIILGNGTNMNSVVMRVLGPAGSTDLNYAGTDFYPGTSLTTLGATVPFGSVTSTGAVTVTKGSFFGNGSGITNLGNANNVNFQPSKAALSNLVGTVANNVTNFVSLSTSNATSLPLTNSYSAGVLTMFGLEQGANITLTPNGSNIVVAATASGGLTTNANQFLGVPLSLKDGVQVTNLTNSGVLTGGIGVFTQETNSGNLNMTASTASWIDGNAAQRITVTKTSGMIFKGTNGNASLLVAKDGNGILISTSALSQAAVPLAVLDVTSSPGGYTFRVDTNYFVVTNALIGIGTIAPLAKLHLTNSTAQTNLRIDQQNTTNPIAQFYNNNTLAIEFTTNGLSTLTSNLLAPTGITAPATTVKWTNPIPENIEVYIDNSGVTGTAIQKNGTTIFTSLVGDVTIGLQRGEYIALTYSVGTPSIKWSPR